MGDILILYMIGIAVFPRCNSAFRNTSFFKNAFCRKLRVVMRAFSFWFIVRYRLRTRLNATLPSHVYNCEAIQLCIHLYSLCSTERVPFQCYLSVFYCEINNCFQFDPFQKGKLC